MQGEEEFHCLLPFFCIFSIKYLAILKCPFLTSQMKSFNQYSAPNDHNLTNSKCPFCEAIWSGVKHLLAPSHNTDLTIRIQIGNNLLAFFHSTEVGHNMSVMASQMRRKCPSHHLFCQLLFKPIHWGMPDDEDPATSISIL